MASPGGVGDGLPSLPSGEPVLARWFVVVMILLVVAGFVVTAVAFLSFGRERISPAERRPLGTSEVTHDRGAAVLNDPELASLVAMDAPNCRDGIREFGDESGRATARVAMNATCQLIARDRVGFTAAATGLSFFTGQGGIVRVAIFERTGVDSSLRFEDGVPVLELNAKFQRETAVEAVPSVVHELTHLGTRGFPDGPVDLDEEVLATQAQLDACDRIPWTSEEPRSCLDARELLDGDTDRLLRDAGYRAGDEEDAG